MAKYIQNTSRIISLATFLFFFFFLFLFLVHAVNADKHSNCTFSRKLSPKKLGLKREKISHLHFYFHDIVSGKKPTAVKVAEAQTTNASATLFGLLSIMDDPLTAGPEPSSKRVGSAQGIYASASQSGFGLLMVFNFVFTEGKYNGSTLSVLGRNTAFSPVREMPIVGGSGLFSFARGYAQARTVSFDLKTGDAVVEYSVYALHY